MKKYIKGERPNIAWRIFWEQKNILKLYDLDRVGPNLKPWRVRWGAWLSVQLIKVSGPNFVGRKPLGSGREMLCNCAEEGARNNNGSLSSHAATTITTTTTSIACWNNNNNYHRMLQKQPNKQKLSSHTATTTATTNIIECCNNDDRKQQMSSHGETTSTQTTNTAVCPLRPSNGLFQVFVYGYHQIQPLDAIVSTALTPAFCK